MGSIVRDASVRISSAAAVACPVSWRALTKDSCAFEAKVAFCTKASKFARGSSSAVASSPKRWLSKSIWLPTSVPTREAPKPNGPPPATPPRRPPMDAPPPCPNISGNAPPIKPELMRPCISCARCFFSASVARSVALAALARALVNFSSVNAARVAAVLAPGVLGVAAAPGADGA